jgi:hypothetical protein
MADAKVHHYVPKLLLRKFRISAAAKRPMIHVFDKKTLASFPTNVKNVASESRFYDFRLDGSEHTVEPILEKIETACEPIIDGILRNKSLPRDPSAAESIATLAIFLSVQFYRTRWMRNVWTEVPTKLAEHLCATEGEEAARQILDQMTLSSEDETRGAISFMFKAARKSTPLFIDKTWFLLRTSGRNPFIIGDNPIVLQNSFARENIWSGIGLATKGIEIYLPLSPTLVLALWDGALVERALTIHSSAPFDYSRRKRMRRQLSHSMATGEALNLESENVLNINSLQVQYAERFLMSSTCDFRLAREMIARDSSISRGPRMEIQ